MSLSHRQLEAFRAMIQTGSVTKTAAKISVSQPATSRLLSDLEHAVGYSLFKREKKCLTPTPEALALFEEVERSFIGLDTISEAAREIGSYRRGALHIVGMPAISLSFLPRVISKFCAERPDITVTLQINSSQKVLQCMASQQFDLGFTELQTTHQGVKSDLLFEAPLIAILPKGHHLCDKAVLGPLDFDGENMVALGADAPMRKKMDAVFLAANVQPKAQIETQLSFAMGQMVSTGAGIALVDPVSAMDLKALSLVETRPFNPSIIYQYKVLFPALQPRSRISDIFLNHVREFLPQKEH